MNTKTDLQWNVLTIKRPGLVRDLPPGKEELMWVANSSTLIRGERDAILVDTFLTTDQSQTLLDWVLASGKNLRDFDRLNEATANARQLYDAMLELYPDRANPGSLWGAANTAKKQA